MGIVLITIPGEDKLEFANELYRKTNGGVDLVIIQKRPRPSLLNRLRRFFRSLRSKDVLKEIWYAVLLRLRGDIRRALGYFREKKVSVEPGVFLAKTLEVSSVNSDEVYETLKRLSPGILAAWGCAILEPRLISCAKKAINLHFGYCPFYRGILANQYAVFCDDFSKIGATVHYINGKPDAGDILAAIPADVSKPPRELFRDLNVRAPAKYLEIIIALHSGQDLPAKPQDIRGSKNFLFKSWVPSVRYAVGKKIIEWERRCSFQK